MLLIIRKVNQANLIKVAIKGRRKLSILSHRPVTSKEERLVFPQSVSTLLQLVSWIKLLGFGPIRKRETL